MVHGQLRLLIPASIALAIALAAVLQGGGDHARSARRRRVEQIEGALVQHTVLVVAGRGSAQRERKNARSVVRRREVDG